MKLGQSMSAPVSTKAVIKIQTALIRWARLAVVCIGVTFLLVAARVLPAQARRPKAHPTPTPTEQPTPSPTPQVKLWNFDDDKAGGPAAGWKPIEGSWSVIADPTAPSQPNTFGLGQGRFLKSLVKLLEYYPFAISSDPTEYEDFTLEADFKTTGGRLDCSGGMIFRYAALSDFYAISAGCPSDYFTFVRVNHSHMQVLKQAIVPVDKDIWYKLKVVAHQDHFLCYFGNKLILEVNDGKIHRGRIGLWARADSQPRYDNVRLELESVTPGEGAPASSPTEAAPAVLSPPNVPTEPAGDKMP